MAPNLITLTGFSFVVINILTLLWYNPTLDQDCPSWVYYSWAIGLFLYQTFDAVDGSQARRTKQSGPLGELFDHGVDAVNTSLEVLIFAGSQNLGMGWKSIMILFGCKCDTSLMRTHAYVFISSSDLLRTNLGRISHQDIDVGTRVRTSRRHPHSLHRICIHRLCWRRFILATRNARNSRRAALLLHSRCHLQHGMERMVHGTRRMCPHLQHHTKVIPQLCNVLCNRLTSTALST